MSQRLEARGFDAYAPRYWLKDEPLAPVFPCYAFVMFDLDDERWPLINDERGVIRLLPMNDPMPLSIPYEFVIECRHRESVGEFHVKGSRLALKYRPGDPVPLIRGALSGWVGRFIKQVNDEIELSLIMLGAERTMRVPVMSVQAP